MRTSIIQAILAVHLEFVSISGTAARYRRSIVGSSHDDTPPDNSALRTRKIYSFPLHLSRFSLFLPAPRHRGINLCTTIEYLKKTTSGAAGIGLSGPG
jgi:hypothetical protein